MSSEKPPTEEIASLRRALKILTLLPIPGLAFGLWNSFRSLARADRLAAEIMGPEFVRPATWALDSGPLLQGGFVLLVLISIVTTIRSRSWSFLYLNGALLALSYLLFALLSGTAQALLRAPLEAMM